MEGRMELSNQLKFCSGQCSSRTTKRFLKVKCGNISWFSLILAYISVSISTPYSCFYISMKNGFHFIKEGIIYNFQQNETLIMENIRFNDSAIMETSISMVFYNQNSSSNLFSERNWFFLLKTI